MGRFIPDEVLDTVRLRADIVDVIQSYVPTLKKNGASWKACCPFHHEKTPSFTVNPERGSYKCFGCGKGGNVISFIMEMEKLDFVNAVEFLANKYSIVIPETGGGRRRGPDTGKPENSFNTRERLYQLHEKLAAWYARNLWEHPESPVAQYFATRHIPKETAIRFQIGASPDSWDAAINFAHKEGFSDEELRLSGLVSHKDETPGRIYDRFRNRLMFPISNEQGRVVAFSARSVEADPQGWKYLNSPETPVFKKSRTLYALHFARESITERKYAVLCEGQLDVIAMHRAGCTNAVAPQGTAFGEEQASILKRYTSEICLAPDNDKAGRAAVFKDAAILLPLGFHLRTAVYPGAKDADELLKSQGPEVLRETVEKACDFFDFAYQTVLEEHEIQTPGGKSAAAAAMAQWLFLLPDPVTLDLYAAWLAEKLGVDKQSILLTVQQHHEKEARSRERKESFDRRKQQAPVREAPEGPAVMPILSECHKGVRQAYYELLELVLADETFAASAMADFTAEMLDQSLPGRALELVIEAEMNGEWEEAPGRILMKLAESGQEDARLSGILMPPEAEANADGVPVVREAPSGVRQKKIYQGCLKVIKGSYYTFHRKELIAKAMQLPDDSAEKQALITELTELTNKIFTVHS